VVTGFSLEFPKDSDRFLEIFTRFAEKDGKIGQLLDDMTEASPEKRERILSLPIYTGFDGES
jgi:hypothetical protein